MFNFWVIQTFFTYGEKQMPGGGGGELIFFKTLFFITKDGS